MSAQDTDTFRRPAATALTNTKPDTYVPARVGLQDGYLLYLPEDNAFIALYPHEFLEIRKEAEANNQAIKELQAANQAVTEASMALLELKRDPEPTVDDLRQAQRELDQALNDLALKSEAAKKCIEPIADLTADPKKLRELVPLTLQRDTTQKTWYVPANKLQSALADRRIYLVDGKAERNRKPDQKLFNGIKPNQQEIKRRIGEAVLDKAKFESKWKLKPDDATRYAGQFFNEWSNTMGAQVQDFLERESTRILLLGRRPDTNNPYRTIDLKSEAQFMRWAAGAGLEANFQPFQGNWHDESDKTWKDRLKRAAQAAQFKIKANANASFAVGEAKVQMSGYFPNCAGWHFIPVTPGGPKDLGHFRFRSDITLYAVAGASVALEASAALLITGDQQTLKGVPRTAKANTNAKSEVSLFAGLKQGIDAKGAIQWLNPEGFIDETSPVRKDPTKTWGEYVDIAEVTTDCAFIQGLSVSGGFEVDYYNGKFVIAAKASACFGLGGSGSLAGAVETGTIEQFFMCVAHQLKQADYLKLASLMRPTVFVAFNQIMSMIEIEGITFRDFLMRKIRNSLEDVENAYKLALVAARTRGVKFLKELEHRMRKKWGWYAYMPPESRGALIALITETATNSLGPLDSEARISAAFSINELLATSQSVRHLNNTLDRLTTSIGEKIDRDAQQSLINNLLEGSSFAGGLQRAQEEIAKAHPMIQRPFMRNDERDFIVAQLPFSHPTKAAST